jgi:hypothetical protein
MIPDGYYVYRDGIEIALITVAGITAFEDDTVAPDTIYSYTVAAAQNSPYGWVVASDQSDPLVVHTPAIDTDPGDLGEGDIPIVPFTDSRMFGGYFGAKLHGKVVACPGNRVSIIKPKC